MINVDKLISNLGSSGIATGFAGGAAGGALTSMLMSKSGRKTGSTLLKVGGAAAIGTLAWKAYKNYQGSKDNNGKQGHGNYENSGQTSHSTNNSHEWKRLQHENFENLDQGVGENQALLVVKTMIAAAMSDGQIDAKEFQNITEKSNKLGLTEKEKSIVFEEMNNPMSIDHVVVSAKTPELAMEIYTASAIVLDKTVSQGKAYLNRLADGLKLPQPLVNAVHNQIEVERTYQKYVS